MDKKAEILLSWVKVALAEHTRLIQDRRKRLNKLTAEAPQRHSNKRLKHSELG